MRVTIKYCRPCGYLKRAEQLAERLRAYPDVSVELTPGSMGVFKIWADDHLVFDKRTTRGLLGKIGLGRVPSDEELLTRLGLSPAAV